MAPLAVVTGASGFVGGAVARHLLHAGYDVLGVARSRAAADAIGRLIVGPSVGRPGTRPSDGRVEPVEGDVLRRASLVDAFEGADLVVHAAGVVAACRRDPTEMLETSVRGTKHVVVAARDAGVRRVVVTSSAATIGERAGEIGREDTPHRGWFLSAYERSKAEAEAAALALGRDLDVEVVVVNPASVQGPGRAEGTARLLLAAARGRLPAVVRTTLSFVDVDDCARGHLLAATRGVPGERYILCGATMSVGEALALVRAITRRPTGRPQVVVPVDAVAALAGAVEGVFRLARRDPPVCREVAAALRHGRAYDGSRAARELGLEYTPAERIVRRTLDWFRDMGLLGSPRTGEATMGRRRGPPSGPRGGTTR